MCESGNISSYVAAAACVFMALFYVAILYAPTGVLRLPPPASFKQFMARRFCCAFISSIFSLLFSAMLLPARNLEAHSFLGVYGMRLDHLWQAVAFPLSLTSLMYSGSLLLNLTELTSSWRGFTCSGMLVYGFRRIYFQAFNMLAWRNYIVAPITEELVFRASMLPLLLCGGFGMRGAITLCPIFFSLAHLNHMFEIYVQGRGGLQRAFMVAGCQLGYTVVFGAYASFLFIRTGNILSPFVSHVFCNVMGLPTLFSRKSGMVAVASVMGILAFVLLLSPLTAPHLYGNVSKNCSCWHAYCSPREASFQL